MKTYTTRLTHRLKHLATASLAALTLMTGLAVAHADSNPFSRIFAFGDSLSDTGNFYALSGGFPPPPYAGGRFCNGKLWVEHVAEALRMEILPGDNYAVAGATTGRDNSNDGFAGRVYPGLQDQIDAFQADHSPADARGALFLVWAGANDFFVALENGIPPQTLIGSGVSSTVQAILRLTQSGARHILVVNVPDLGLTPFAQSASLGAPITQLSAAYNQVLADALDALAVAGISTIRVDAFATLQSMASNPTAFGFTDVTQAFLATGGNPDEFLFWDAVHPTTMGHAFLAQEAANRLIAQFSPSQGKGLPPSRINGLRGLVRARNH